MQEEEVVLLRTYNTLKLSHHIMVLIAHQQLKELSITKYASFVLQVQLGFIYHSLSIQQLN